MALKCEAGIVYCTTPADAQCVVCGRFFCRQHGNLAAPHCRRCTRAYVAQQRATAAAAVETNRREMAAALNRNGQCGWVGCDGPMLVLCGHCGLHYCASHSNRYRYHYRYRSRRGVESRQAAITLCDACKSQLKLYKREKTWLEA